MRCGRLLAAGLFVVGLATMVEAQRPNRQPGQGGTGGFGRGFMDVNTLVLSNEALQEEVKITADQKTKFKPVADKQAELQKKMTEMFKGGGGGNKGKGGGGFAEIQKDREKIAEEAKSVVDTTLTTDQKARLKQIGVQVLGVRAFTNEEVVAALKLTDDQKDKIKGIAEEYQKDARELGGGFRPGQSVDQEKLAENQKKRRKLEREAVEKITTSLTPDQQAEWKKLIGEPFDTTKLQPQPRRKD
jgi:Spy/CpxP family protein refolding chaperone